MKINEVTEDVKFVNDTTHAIERVKVTADICEKLGNTPILYRMFKGGETQGNLASNLMIKVDNTGRKGIKGNHNIFQQKIFDGLGATNPTQALTVTPKSISGFHGTNFIMIPGGDYAAYWHPEISDLGGFKGYDDKYKTKQDPNNPNASSTLVRPDNDDTNEEVRQALAGYKQGIPSQSEHQGEVIVDCPYYYMLNLQEFLSKFAGKKSKELVNVPKGRGARLEPGYGDIKQELLQAKFKTYRDLGWYLNNPTMNFLNWWKEKEEENNNNR